MPTTRRIIGSGRPILAFTLIELLVVISIITLLISILLPVLGNARENTKRVYCLSNLRQIGVASHTYAVDNRYFLPQDDGPYDPTTAVLGGQLRLGFGVDGGNNPLLANQNPGTEEQTYGLPSIFNNGGYASDPETGR